LLFTCWLVLLPAIRNEYEKAVSLSVQTDMRALAVAATTYKHRTGQWPSSVGIMIPDLQDTNVVARPARHMWLSMKVLVPETPYSLEEHDGDLLITCPFYSMNSGRIVLPLSSNEFRFQQRVRH